MADTSIKHIIDAIENNRTSIGDNPALPPGSNNILAALTKRYYANLPEDTLDEEGLSKAMAECVKEEMRCRPMLEELAAKWLANIFHFEGNENLTFETVLVDSVDTSNIRMCPEDAEDFSFEDIDEMNSLADEIYKRRMLNALIAGASQEIGFIAESHIEEVKKINRNLPALYEKIIKSNEKLLFEKNIHDSLNGGASYGGKVSVYISSEDKPVEIKAEGVILPILVCEGAKGILELAISHGLPKERKKAMYVMSKADFKFAELWDQRVGLVLWNRMCEVAEASGHDCLLAVGINHLFMEMACMDVDDFNHFISNVLAKTKMGVSLFKELCDKIEYELEHDDFESFVGDMEKIRGDKRGVSFYDSENADELLIADDMSY